jgi:hypothetical protein
LLHSAKPKLKITRVTAMNNNKNDMLGYEDFVKRSERYKGLPWSVLEKHSHALNDYANYCEQYKKKYPSTEKIEQVELDDKVLETDAVAEITAMVLPVWKDTLRAAPNCILRSALFGAVPDKDRHRIEREEVASIDRIKFTYTGEQLNQGDFDVWCGVIQMARNKAGTFTFTSSEMLKLLGLPTSNGAANHKVLYRRLHRLNESVIHAQINNTRYNASLIDWFVEIDIKEKNKDSAEKEILYARAYDVRINDIFLLLFAPDKWSSFDWEARQKLGGKSLALWLHCFYSTHQNPYPYSVSKIHNLCGSRAKGKKEDEKKELRKFRYELKKAIEAMCEVTGWQGGINNDDNVFVIKNKKIENKSES